MLLKVNKIIFVALTVIKPLHYRPTIYEKSSDSHNCPGIICTRGDCLQFLNGLPGLWGGSQIPDRTAVLVDLSLPFNVFWHNRCSDEAWKHF
jgi:hypothetical protein